MDGMVSLPWRRALDLIAEYACGRYRWALHQCEYATDVMFRSPQALAALYPSLARFAITDLGSKDTMRYLGKPLAATFRGEVVTNYEQRPEGICVRHSVAGNPIQIYDEQGSVLRIETTTNKPDEFKSRRRAEGDPDSELEMRRLRKGITGIKTRIHVSDQVNSRYLDALASVECDRSVADVIGGRTVRALEPWSDPDISLLRAIARSEFVANGLRSRDVAPHLGPPVPNDPVDRCKFMAKLSRHRRILRAYGVIEKIAGTHRYRVIRPGRALITAVIAALDTSVTKLEQCAWETVAPREPSTDRRPRQCPISNPCRCA